MNEIVEAEVIEGTEVVEVPPTANLFHSNNPAEVLKRARETAEAFKPVVTAQSVTIQGKQHVQVEGWMTLGAMLGVTAVCAWTRKLDNGWEARVEARTLDGRVIGAAEAECLRDEGRWKTADDYAVRSMAQTRATSKALASVLRFVATLAGAEGTPAEEMPREGFKPNGSSGGVKTSTGFASAKQQDFMESLLQKAGVTDEDRGLIILYCKDELSGERDGPISKGIDGLKERPDEFAGRLLFAAVKWRERQSDIPADDSDLPDVEPGEPVDDDQLPL